MPPADREPASGASLAWRAARLYARLYGIVKDTTGLNLRGLGRLLRLVGSDHVIRLAGCSLIFDHRFGGSYTRLVAGDFNESETYRLLEHIFAGLDGPFTFINCVAVPADGPFRAACEPVTVR